ncbi:MAG: hypothetical protein JNM93_08350 [Bacteriovoracaceae bacterium]|nr:hypothetical protein [Bacteriovoracaceae bacterium]
MQSKENRKYYLKPLENHQSEGLSKDIVKPNTLFHFWKKGKSSIYKMSLASFTKDTLNFKRPDIIDDEMINDVIDKPVLLKITQGENQYFTNGVLLFNADRSALVFKLVETVFKNVQRKDCRIMVSDFVKVSFVVDKQQYSCLDVSAGGTSFYCEPKSAEKFEKEMKFANCELKFNGTKFKIPNCRVALKIGPDETGNVKVGVQFLDMSYKVEDEIWILINKEMKRVYIQENIVEEALKKVS